MRPFRAVTALLGLALVGSLVTGTAPATAAEPDPLYGAPAVGDCYDLTKEQAWGSSTREKPVDCSTRHTLLVGAVGTLPASVGYDEPAKFRRAVKRICDPFWLTYYDLDDHRSYRTVLQGIWLGPTKTQRKNGARWVSCSISLALSTSLQPLPEGGPAKATARPDDSIARCATKRYLTTVCTKRHAWRVTHSFSAKARGKGDVLEARLERAAVRVCSRRIDGNRWLWGSRSTTKRNTYALVCLAKTRK